MKKKYYPELQTARGILTILVVLGHIVTQISVSYGPDADAALAAIGSVIYSFHMPAFFFISGFVSVKLLDLVPGKKTAYIKEKFMRLMIPYFTMGIVYFPARLLLANMANNSYSAVDFPKILIGENPDGALWFLYVLFMINVIAALFVNRRNLLWLIGPVFVAAMFAANYGFFFSAAQNTVIYFGYFLLGLWVRDSKKDIRKIPLWSFLTCASLFIVMNTVMQDSSDHILYIIAALSGTLCLLFLCIKLEHIHPRILPFLGDYSMDIFIFSEPVKVIVRYLLKGQSLPIMLLGCLIAAIAVPILISKFIIRKIPVFRKLFLGMQ